MKERQVVRAVVLDVHDRILLLHSQDLSARTSARGGKLPGGGLDPGETHEDAIIRELYPGPLPSLLVPFLDGERIDEPFERWS